MFYIGWLGTALLIGGLVCVGEKKRYGFAVSAVGEALWCIKAVSTEQYDLLSVCAAFAAIQVWNWFKWGRQ